MNYILVDSEKVKVHERTDDLVADIIHLPFKKETSIADAIQKAYLRGYFDGVTLNGNYKEEVEL